MESFGALLCLGALPSSPIGTKSGSDGGIRGSQGKSSNFRGTDFQNLLCYLHMRKMLIWLRNNGLRPLRPSGICEDRGEIDIRLPQDNHEASEMSLRCTISHLPPDFSLTLPPGCVGQELCMEKPIDYPTEEIDRVAKRLARRLRRHSATENATAAPDHGDGNNCVEKRQESTPFLFLTNITNNYVIQSEFFKQTITTVTCRSEGASCFGFLDTQGFTGRTYCQTKYSSVFFVVYDFKEKRLEQINTSVPVDCTCMVEF